ncbi:Plant protein of unknown function D [Prunus dulcis]|uniref:Uncharacterized protein n=1 Tax=Prunus dulcis TaxID=3755 RepID=A0A4Y1RQX1_PRUDU|nr:Plant protein of unknown function D [Prunus dulcis]
MSEGKSAEMSNSGEMCALLASFIHFTIKTGNGRSYEQQCYDKVEKASEALNIFEVPNKLRKVKRMPIALALSQLGFTIGKSMSLQLCKSINIVTGDSLRSAIKPHLKANGKQAPNSLTSLALHFFEPAAMKNQKAIIKGVDDPPGGTEGYKHLLDLLHKFYLPSQPKSTNNKQHPAGAGDSSIINITNIDIPGSGSYNNWGFNYCASQLLESGIEIERQSSEKHLLNITFSKGVIRIPSLFIDDNISLLRNLIAYEQYSISSNHITSYPILLKSLIRSSKDIKILRQRRIINSNWIDDEVYLAQCHSILDEVVVKDFCFADLCNQVNAYARKFWFRRRLKSLYRTYFSTAWSLISGLGHPMNLICSDQEKGKREEKERKKGKEKRRERETERNKEEERKKGKETRGIEGRKRVNE